MKEKKIISGEVKSSKFFKKDNLMLFILYKFIKTKQKNIRNKLNRIDILAKTRIEAKEINLK